MPPSKPVDIPVFCHGPLETKSHSATTLQSVLLGEVPAAYSHLTTPRMSPSISPRPSSHHSQFSISPSPPPNTYHQDEPIDLSVKSTKSETMDISDISAPSESKSDFSILRSLLCIGKTLQSCPDEGRRFHHDTFQDEYRPESPLTHLSRATRVTLAKKNMFPVSSRVSDWLLKIVQFAKTIPEFTSLSHNDKVTLILSSWTRLLLLYMAENNFQFAVTPLAVYSQDTVNGQSLPAPDQPTMKSVDGVQSFIRKCQNMDLDQKEYAFLRMVVLFNAGMLP